MAGGASETPTLPPTGANKPTMARQQRRNARSGWADDGRACPGFSAKEALQHKALLRPAANTETASTARALRERRQRAFLLLGPGGLRTVLVADGLPALKRAGDDRHFKWAMGEGNRRKRAPRSEDGAGERITAIRS